MSDHATVKRANHGSQGSNVAPSLVRTVPSGVKSSAGSVLVASPDEALVAGIREALAPEKYRLIIRSSALAAADLTAQVRLDAIVLDAARTDLPLTSFVETLRRHPESALTPLIAVVATSDPETLGRCLEQGAEDALAPPLIASHVRTRVRAFVRMRQRFDSALSAQAGHQSLSSLLRLRVAALADEVGLSAREREVLDLVMLGRSTSEMATAMSISERTTKFHVANVLHKLGIESRLELFRLLM